MEKIKKYMLVIIPISLVLVVILIGVFFVYLQEKDRAYKLEDTQREEYLKSKSSSEEAVQKEYSSIMASARSKAEASKKKSDYDECIKGVQESFTLSWNKACKTYGDKKIDSCALPTNMADTLNDSLEKKEEACLQIYKAN